MHIHIAIVRYSRQTPRCMENFLDNSELRFMGIS
jgi:hypothetical protein